MDSTMSITEQHEDVKQASLTSKHAKDGIYRILSLDGGGAKGFYTLGVLKEIEGMLKCPLYQRFDLIFGTSTGAVIAALIALGYEIDEIHELYKENVVHVMKMKSAKGRSKALAELGQKI